MHESSSSQEIETEYVAWRAPDSPAIVIRRRVMEGIHHEVNLAVAAVSNREDECGGILLGSRTAGQILVEDFEPVPPEADREALEETLHWFRSSAPHGLAVLGFYRSHTRPDFALTEEDGEILRAHFGDAEDLVLLIKPGNTDASVADIWVHLHGRADAVFVPIPFPLTEAEAPEPEPAPAQPLLLPAPAAISWPPPRPRLLEVPEPRNRKWLWFTGFAALGVAAGALGYLWLHPASSPAPKAPAAAPTSAAAPKPAPSPPEQAPETAPAPGAADSIAIHELLDRWASALKRGDVQAATACYAPLVSSYFGRHSMTREAVRGRIRKNLAHNGGLDVYRISDVKITPVSDGRAVATFRKTWRTSGRRRFAGEEQERMTLVRHEDAWQISSEQQEKIYWQRKPR